MLINEYVKKWYDENYDVRQEDFYIDNAYWTIGKHWFKGGIKNGIFALLVSAGAFLISSGSMMDHVLSGLTMLAIVTVSFFFYAIREYDENDWEMSRVIYVLVFIFLMLTKKRVGVPIQWIFAIGGTVLYFYLTFVQPIKLSKLKRHMKKRMKEMEEQEEQANKERGSKFEEEFKAYRYGLPEFDVPEGDPVLAEARKLFEGYTDTKDMMKTRYRQLAKKHHPDNGGDEHLFQCIIEIYEELCHAVE